MVSDDSNALHLSIHFISIIISAPSQIVQALDPRGWGPLVKHRLTLNLQSKESTMSTGPFMGQEAS